MHSRSARADRCNIFNYLLETPTEYSLFLNPRQMLRKIVFLEQFFGIALLDSGRRSFLGFQWGLAANNSSGDLHGTYVKQTKALSLIRFCDKDKGKVLEVLILKQVIQFQASWTWYWKRGRHRRCPVYMCGTNKRLKNIISESCFLFFICFSSCALYYLILYEK